VGGDSGNDQVTVPRDVKVPLSLEAVALYGDTEKAVAEKLGNLASMRSDTGGLDLRVASTALVGLDDGVESLLDYPYGCTEQLTSRLVPLVALVDLAKDYGIKLPEKADRIADEAIAKIMKNQRSDGGFGYWPDSPEADVWVTTYTVWALSIAKERGRPVPAAALDNAVKWLRDQIAACSKPHASARWHCGDGDTVYAQHAFILDVLASTGQADAGFTQRVFEHRAKMPLFARALLAHAMVVSKMRMEDAKELVRDAENYVRVTPTGATIVENLTDQYAPLLDSEARTTAIVIRTLVAIDPQHPLAARLAKGLLAARRGGVWRSTQENAWALIALDDYRKAQEAKAPDFDAEVFFGDKLLFSAPFHGRSVKSQTATVPAANIMGKGGEPLAFQVHGTGRLFYEARLRYAKKELPTTPIDRGFYVRKLVRSLKPEALADAMRVLPQSSMTSANASDLVLVDLLVVTPDPREQVVIDDPLPAGLEPVQSALATTARDLSVTEPGDMGDASDADDARDMDARATGKTFNQSWYHREFHDDRVLTFVDHMAAGMYHYRYLARATTAGKFIVPPTKAECMYEPETFGRTAAATFEVKK
jgi:alpha-2-macroglobulin